MASSSIPNSNPGIGRTSTPWLARSRKQNNPFDSFSAALRLTSEVQSSIPRHFNAQRSTRNAQRAIQKIRRWALDVGYWTFSFVFRRVKGAWWPSRSSKPSSVGNVRGRFDSYPLRQFIFDFRFSISDCSRPGLIARLHILASGYPRLIAAAFFLSHWERIKVRAMPRLFQITPDLDLQKSGKEVTRCRATEFAA